MKVIFTYMSVLLFLFSSCVKVDEMQDYYDGQKVPVSLSVSLCDEEGTRSVHESHIHNLWVIQFGGTSGNSKVLGKPIYIEDFASFDGNVELMETTSPCSICFIANTFEGPGEFGVSAITTIDDILDMKRVVSEEAALMGSSGLTNDDGSKRYHTMFNSLIEVDKVDSELIAIDAYLKRNIVKTTITLSLDANVIDKENLKISSLQICSVPSISYYVTNRPASLSSPFPYIQDFKRVNYAPVLWQDNDGDNSMSLTVYLPVNMRGESASSNSESLKNKYAPDGATYLLVSATYGDQNYPLTYTFYLGENMISDYNLRPNYSYDFDFNITSKGDADKDFRVMDWGLVDFTDTDKYPLSNSYILNPNLTEGEWRYFRIPLEKANIFWGGQGYEPKNANFTLNNNSWKSYVLASDFEITDENFRLVKSSGSSGDQYFEVAVRSGVKGNVIIAAGTSTTSISWSWHLWITDYDPSIALNLGEGADGQYIYPVTNGNVHRYAGDFWNANRESYMMDRHLGSFTSDVYSVGNEGFLYYQFGRKDPFFANLNVYRYPSIAGNAVAGRVTYDAANHDDVNGVRYSVQNPLSYIERKDADNSYWTYGNQYNPSVEDKTILWNDPATAKGNANEGEKSFFDPCPPGYRLPHHNAYADFTYNNRKNGNTNVLEEGKKDLVRGFASFTALKGLQYWPYDGNALSDKVIFFPAIGHHETPANASTTFKVSNNGAWLSLWSDRPSSSKSGYRLFAREGHVSVTQTTRRDRAFPVRCITDNYRN